MRILILDGRMEGKGEGNGANSLFPRWANVRDGELGKQQRGRSLARSLGRHKFLPPKKSAGEKVDEAGAGQTVKGQMGTGRNMANGKRSAG